MAKDVRATMVAGAARLLSQRGFEATSFAEVLDATGAPRGSIYHHFPDGKAELVTEAVRHAGAVLAGVLDAVDTDDPAEVMAVFLEVWRGLLSGSELGAGCAVAAVATGAPLDDRLRAATAEVFKRWEELLTARLERGGIAGTTARGLAVTAIAAVEGALVLARSTQDLERYDLVARQVQAVVGQAERTAP